MLTDDMLTYIDRSVLCWLATVDADGAPNVSPKEVFAARDRDTVLVANIASPNTVRNIRSNPRVCLSFVDVFVQKGYKLRGSAEVVAAGEARYNELSPPLATITQGSFKIHSIIVIRVSVAEAILAPSYRLHAGVTEESQFAAALRTYGVTPVHREPPR